jgi:hypothetical protein
MADMILHHINQAITSKDGATAEMLNDTFSALATATTSDDGSAKGAAETLVHTLGDIIDTFLSQPDRRDVIHTLKARLNI